MKFIMQSREKDSMIYHLNSGLLSFVQINNRDESCETRL